MERSYWRNRLFHHQTSAAAHGALARFWPCSRRLLDDISSQRRLPLISIPAALEKPRIEPAFGILFQKHQQSTFVTPHFLRPSVSDVDYVAYDGCSLLDIWGEPSEGCGADRKLCCHADHELSYSLEWTNLDTIMAKMTKSPPSALSKYFHFLHIPTIGVSDFLARCSPDSLLPSILPLSSQYMPV